MPVEIKKVNFKNHNDVSFESKSKQYSKKPKLRASSFDFSREGGSRQSSVVKLSSVISNISEVCFSYLQSNWLIPELSETESSKQLTNSLSSVSNNEPVESLRFEKHHSKTPLA